MYNISKKNFLALFGNPVKHSKSPLMYNTAFKELGMDYEFLAIEADKNNLEDILDDLVKKGLYGFSCTMPVKTKMYKLCNELSDSAKLMKAVNTVLVKDGKFIGHNTDGKGLVRAIEEAGFFVRDNTFTLFGTGGAASAICTQLALDGVKKINIFGRKGKSYSELKNLVDELMVKTKSEINLCEYNDDGIKKSINESEVLINCSSVGMKDENASIVKEASWLKKGMLVYDIVYEPLETKLLKMAKEQGCVALNGINMLYYQGVEAFKIWTGKNMPESIKDIF